MKHISGRRYGCPCNEWVDACGTCEYAVRACRPTNAWEQLGAVIKDVAAYRSATEKRCAKWASCSMLEGHEGSCASFLCTCDGPPHAENCSRKDASE